MAGKDARRRPQASKRKREHERAQTALYGKQGAQTAQAGK